MQYAEIEEVIRAIGLPLQSVLHAAFVLEQTATIGGNCCLGQGSGRVGDPTVMLDRVLSITQHIRDGERGVLLGWSQTSHIEPHHWPRLVTAFWCRVSGQAVKDLARVIGDVV